METSKKDIFGNPIPKTSKEKQQKFEYLSAKLNKAHELSTVEQEALLDDIVLMIANKD